MMYMYTDVCVGVCVCKCVRWQKNKDNNHDKERQDPVMCFPPMRATREREPPPPHHHDNTQEAGN